MTRLVIPCDILEKLRCISCNEYLSIFPVHVKIVEESALCGRCKVPKESDYLRDEAYEDIAQFLIFPCCHAKNGCQEQLTPRKLKEHENKCLHKKLECPSKAFSKCDWSSTGKDLLAHFQTKHDKLLLKDKQFEINFINNVKENLLLVNNEDIFVVEKEVDVRCGTFSCTVTQVPLNENSEKNLFCLTVNNGNNNSHIFADKSTTPGSEDRTVRFELDFIKEKLNDPAIIVASIEIKKAGSVISEITKEDGAGSSMVSTEPKKPAKNPNVDWDLLEELECPICLDFMLPPIYQCLNGHSICAECKPKINICPLCKGAVNNTQNFTLEKLTTRMQYPCKFHKNGCDFVTKSADIRNHESACEYGPYECPLKEVENCETKASRTDILKHIENNHDDFVLKNDKINIKFNRDTTENKYYLIKFSAQVFKVYYNYENEKFKWAVQIVGSANEAYKFEVDVIDNSGNKLRHYVRGLCVPLSNKNIFQSGRNYVSLDYEQIAHYINDTLSYRIRVMKD